MTGTTPAADFWAGKKVTVTGGAGFLGKAVMRQLDELGADARVIRSADYDLRDRAPCFEALEGARVVLHLAANVGGIGYNRAGNPGPLAHDNTAMGLNVFEACRELKPKPSLPARSAPIPSSRRSRSRRTTSGTAIPRSRTRPTGSRRKC